MLTQRRVVSVYEGGDVQLTCNLRANYLPSNEITWFNNQGMNIKGTVKYTLLRTSAWANLTVRDVHETQDSGEYRCSTSNAVGGTEINVTLLVKSTLLSFCFSPLKIIVKHQSKYVQSQSRQNLDNSHFVWEAIPNRKLAHLNHKDAKPKECPVCKTES